MSEENKKDSFTLEPSWKQFFIPYVLSVITIPILVGLAAFYFVRRKHKSIRYQIANTRITATDQKYEHNVDLVDIKSVEIQRSWLQEQLDIGTLVLHTSASKMELLGLNNPEQIKELLDQAIQSEQKREQQLKETRRKEPDSKPGSMERMDYLTGLWQQGLISDQEYENERKHFE